MTTFKKILALVMAMVMVLSLVACGGSNTPAETKAPEANAPAETEAPETPATPSGEKRKITIGVHWDWHYDSADEDVYADPAYVGSVADQMRFEVVEYVENKYNVEFEYVDLTWDGVRESINTSVLAGTPECDLYLVDLAAGVSAAMNGLAIDLKTVLPEDADILSDQVVLSYQDIGGKACLITQVKGENVVADTYPLAFNKQMLEANNLEDPRELYKRGEWTWDKFVEYCQVLTQDTDGDGVTDQYGFTGFVDDYLGLLLMSNGADIAAGEEEHLSSAATGEVLQFIHDLHNTYKVCEPYNFEDPVDYHRTSYRNGNIGFWVSAAWMTGTDYDWDGSVGTTLEFDTVYVPWPVGPSGNQETNKGKMTGGSYFIIPTGVEDPELVYNIFEDITNWYMGDTSVRDDKEALWWWYAVTAKDPVLQEENFQVMFDIGSKTQFDLYTGLGLSWELANLINGTMTGAQFQETYRQQVQDALDNYFG